MKLIYKIRTIIAVLFYPFFLIFYSGSVALQNFIFAKRNWDNYLIALWGRLSCVFFGVKVQVHGQENLPEGGAIFLFNHTSFFDVFAMIGYLPNIRFGAKIELFSIPIFGYAMNRVGMLPIARENRNEVIRVYQAAQKRIENGERFALAPEGTRQEVEKLGNFKAGPFIFAINAKAPIVPIVIKGAAAILPKGSTFPNWGVPNHQIDIYVLPVVETAGMTIASRGDLQEKIRNQMLEYFKE